MSDPTIHPAVAEPIALENVTKSYDDNMVIPPLSTEFRAGEFTVILDPSGCGKSTLLQLIAGLERVSGGTIRIGAREVQKLEPKARGCAMVFQNYALYPHMRVCDNIGYSLKVAGMAKADRRARVEAVARMLDLEHLLDRRPAQLSGGQRQRVAIGRAIVREPSVLLFDEPLSNLDAKLRQDMRVELADLHRRIGASTVFVTHDQTEAMTLADRLLILNKGRVEQFDTPRNVYRNPASTFVAGFIGAPPMNLLAGEADGRSVMLNGRPLADCSHRGPVSIGIRPEEVALGGTPDHGSFSATLVHREHLGSHEIVSARLESGEMIRAATAFTAMAPVEDGAIELAFPSASLRLFDAQTGLALS